LRSLWHKFLGRVKQRFRVEIVKPTFLLLIFLMILLLLLLLLCLVIRSYKSAFVLLSMDTSVVLL